MENKTLIIYDLNGTILQQVTGFYKVPNGVPYIEVIIPQGKRVVSVNVDTKEPILEDIPPTEVEILTDKISILTKENEELLESQKVQDRTIIETDMRMMDLEFLLEDLIMGVGVNTKINLSEVFTMERSAVYFNQLKQMIEMENYDSKEDMERILNKYLDRKRITQEEYNELFDLLYPSKYEVNVK